MQQTAVVPIEQTIIFGGLFFVVFLWLLRKKQEPLNFSLLVTSELKGFAILTIILGHIGYFLFTDHGFLYPFSTISGVGVDIFFLLSGYGLALSSMKKNYVPLEFYRRRVGKIFLPLWIVLVLLLLLDAFLLGRFYDWSVMVRSFLGLYPSADIYNDLNSPLWYLTPLFFYYLVFPWVFKPRWAVFSGFILALLGYVLLSLPLPVTEGVRNLYSLHYLAFPLGVVLAGLSSFTKKFHSIITTWARYILLIVCGGVFFYAATAGGSGLTAQLLSLLCTLMVLFIFIATKLYSRLFEIFGNYSYEIYLLHWPLLYRYDFLYRFLPPGVATFLYLIVMLGLAWALRKIVSFKALPRN